MSTQVQHRRGTAAQHATFTGAEAEITYDSTNKQLRVHDGAKAGGHATAREPYPSVAAMQADTTAWPPSTHLSVRGTADYEVVTSDPDLTTPALLRAVSPQAIFRPESFESGPTLTDYGLQKAIYAAMRAFEDGRPATVLLPSREIICSNPLDSIERPISIIGNGWRNSTMRLVGDGSFITPRNVGFGPENANDYPRFGDAAYVDPSTMRSGLTLSGFQITGDRSSDQNAIVFQGNCDNVLMSDVMVSYVSGHAVHMGASADGINRGGVRESVFSNIISRRCGTQDGAAAIFLHRQHGGDESDSSNILQFNNVQIVYPQGPGFHIRSERSASGNSGIYGVELSNLMLHGQLARENNGTAYPDRETEGDLLLIEGNVSYVKGNVYIAYQNSPDHDSVNIQPLQIGSNPVGRPMAIDLDVKMPRSQRGVRVGVVNDATIRMIRPIVAEHELIDEGASKIHVEVVQPARIVTFTGGASFSGTSTITLPAATSNALLTDFFIGDTYPTSVRCAISGVIGTATRTAVGTVEFTPDATPPNSFVSEQELVLTRILVNRSRWNSGAVSGSWPGFRREQWAGRIRRVDLSESILPRRSALRAGGLSDVKYAGIQTLQSTSSLALFATDSGGTARNLMVADVSGDEPVLRILSDMRFEPLFDDEGKLRLGGVQVWVNLTTNMLTYSGSTPASESDGEALQNTRNGATGARPASPVTAQQYFDTSLGKPIWWSGTAWVDATGTTV